MSQKYKVLSAILALRQFTSAELAKVTGVNLTTVHTILTREKWRFDLIKTEETKNRGGQPKVYRLKTNQVNTLQEEIERMYPIIIGTNKTIQKSLPVEGISSRDLATSSVEELEEVRLPFGLEMAKDLLHKDYNKAKSIKEKQQTLHLAGIYLDGARDEIQTTPSTKEVRKELQHYVSHLESLSQILTLELEADKGRAIMTHKKVVSVTATANRFSVIKNLAKKAARFLFADFPTLHSKYFQLPKEQLHFNKSPDTVLLIDTIAASSDVLTSYIAEILRSLDINTKITQMPKASYEIKHYLKNQPTPQMCLITVDSDSTTDSIETLYHQVLDVWKEKETVHILDQNSDPIVRNIFTSDNVNYISYARELQPKAIMAELKLNDNFEDIPKSQYL